MDAARLLQAAIDRSHQPYTLKEVVAEISAGRSVAFWGEESVMVCTLHRHHDEITGHVWLASGDLDELRDVLRPQAEAWAKAEGAAYATIEGRKGWVRALEGVGFEEVAVTARKALR